MKLCHPPRAGFLLLAALVLLAPLPLFGQIFSSAGATVNNLGQPIGAALIAVCASDPGDGSAPCSGLAITYTDGSLSTECQQLSGGLPFYSYGYLWGPGCTNPGRVSTRANYTIYAATGTIYWAQVYGYGFTTYVMPFATAGGGSSGCDTTWAGDLSGTCLTQKVIGLESVPLDSTTVGAPPNSAVVEYSTATNKYEAYPGVYDIAFSLPGGINNSGGTVPATVLPVWTAPRNVRFPANFGVTPDGATSVGQVGTDPASSAVFTLFSTPGALSGGTCSVTGSATQIGTITIATSGVFTFASTGGTAVTMDQCYGLSVEVPASSDADLNNIMFTLAGYRL